MAVQTIDVKEQFKKVGLAQMMHENAQKFYKNKHPEIAHLTIDDCKIEAWRHPRSSHALMLGIEYPIANQEMAKRVVSVGVNYAYDRATNTVSNLTLTKRQLKVVQELDRKL